MATNGILPPHTMNWNATDCLRAFKELCRQAQFWLKDQMFPYANTLKLCFPCIKQNKNLEVLQLRQP